MENLKTLLSLIETGYPGLSETCRTILSVVAATRLQRTHPLALILIGGASSGKTSLLMPLTKGSKGSILYNSVLRVDDFTPASLVSHAANRSIEQLEKIDLLPRMRSKCVIVKEMAPMFTGHEDELMKKFGVLASVLDGEGYCSSSGSHGERGYQDKITFSLLGAVTPDVLTPKVFKALNAVGPRFCFLEMPRRQISIGSWRGPGSDRKEIESQISKAIQQFVGELFDRYPPDSLLMEELTIAPEVHEQLSRLAILMASLRSKTNAQKDEDGHTIDDGTSSESPERAFRYLEQIAAGSALISGRNAIVLDDLHSILNISLSSALPGRKRIVRQFFELTEDQSTGNLAAYAGMNVETATKYIQQLCALDIVERTNYDGATTWNLKPPFKNLRSLLARVDKTQSEVHRTSDTYAPAPSTDLFSGFSDHAP